MDTKWMGDDGMKLGRIVKDLGEHYWCYVYPEDEEE